MHLGRESCDKGDDDPTCHQFEYFSKEKALAGRRAELYEEMMSKADMFDKCLKEVDMKQGYPSLDLNRSFLGRFMRFPRTFPVDSTEEKLMRNSVKSQLNDS